MSRVETKGSRAASPGDYDPHEHRVLANGGTTDLETLGHLVKAALGTGVMAIPQAFGRAGFITASIAMVLATGVLTHCLMVVTRSRYEACRRRQVPILTYSDSVEECISAGPPKIRALATAVGKFVTVILLTFQLGTACIYIVFMAETLRKLIDEDKPITLYMAMLVIPLVAFALVPNLKVLAPFSMLANLFILIGLGIVFYFIFSEDGEVVNQDELNLWGKAVDFPMFFGTALFALCSVGVVLQVENNMKNPKTFGKPCGTLHQSMIMVVVLYVAFGVCGYALYCGDKCKDTITLNLPSGPLPMVVNCLLAVAIFISYVLHIFLPMECIWSRVKNHMRQDSSPRRLMFFQCLTRIVIVLCTFIAAAAVPMLSLFISLCGALCMSLLGICFPVMMEACLAYPYSKKDYPMLAKDGILFLFGMMALISGTCAAIKEIVEYFM